MGPLSRRSLVIGIGTALAGCVGPSLEHDDIETAPTDDADDEFSAEDLDHVESAVNAAVETFEGAIDTFERWESDPESVSVEAFDDIRSQTTATIDQYNTHVFPNVSEFDDGSVDNDWEADGTELAELIDMHESLLFAIEDVVIAILDVDADPDHLSTHNWERIEFITESGPAVVAETESALNPN